MAGSSPPQRGGSGRPGAGPGVGLPGFSDPATALTQLADLDPPADLAQRFADLEFLARRMLLVDEPGALGDDEAARLYLEGLRRLEAGDFDGALERFIASMREDRALDDEAARRTCVALFRFLGQEHPAVAARRGEFAGALYV